MKVISVILMSVMMTAYTSAQFGSVQFGSGLFNGLNPGCSSCTGTNNGLNK